MPQQILSDRDPKFLLELWTGLFTHLRVKLLLSTAWHPQTDGASERTNQTIEIALQYHVAEHLNTSWSETLISLQVTLNNSENASTGKTPTELMYSLKVNEGLSLLSATASHHDAYDLTQARDLHCWQTQDSQLFASMWSKRWYDMKHKKIDLKEGELIYLQLHHGYNLSGLQNTKLLNQRVGPFKIIGKIGFLTYCLELPCTMKIHPVIFITHLKPCPIRDPYKRPRPDQPPPVLDEPGDWQSYKIEKVLDSRQRQYSCEKPITEYLMRWKGYGSEHDEWYGEDLLDQSMEMMIDFEQRQGNVEAVHNLQDQLQCASVSSPQSDQTSAATPALPTLIVRSTPTTAPTTSAGATPAAPAAPTSTTPAAPMSTTPAAPTSTTPASTEVSVPHPQLDCRQRGKKTWGQPAGHQSESWDYNKLRCWEFQT